MFKSFSVSFGILLSLTIIYWFVAQASGPSDTKDLVEAGPVPNRIEVIEEVTAKSTAVPTPNEIVEIGKVAHPTLNDLNREWDELQERLPAMTEFSRAEYEARFFDKDVTYSGYMTIEDVHKDGYIDLFPNFFVTDHNLDPDQLSGLEKKQVVKVRCQLNKRFSSSFFLTCDIEL